MTKSKLQHQHWVEQFYETRRVGIDPLKGDGSDRKLYRVYSQEKPDQTNILVEFENIAENKDFTNLTVFFKNQRLAVPHIHFICPEHSCYILEDLGTENLADLVHQWRESGKDELVLNAYREVMDLLIDFQKVPTDWFQKTYPSRVMNRELFEKDLDYFKSHFLDRLGLGSFLNEALESNFREILETVSEIPIHPVLVHRDFQNRNIMFMENRPYMIDYQSALIGSPCYDLACFLYSSRAMLTNADRDQLLEYYWKASGQADSLEAFVHRVDYFILIRRLRSLGSYGFLAFEKGKHHFLSYFPNTFRELLDLLTTKPAFEHFHPLKTLLIEAERVVLSNWL